MFNFVYIFLFLYLSFTVMFNESYKVIAKNMKKAGALTILVELIAGSFSLLFIPFFKIQFPNEPKIYILLSLAIIFYALQNRLATTSRSGMEASTYAIIKQLSNVFVTIMGFVFLKEELTIKKSLGITLLIGSNILVFYKKRSFKINRYVLLGIIANLCMGMALFLDVNTSSSFNLAFYVTITLLIPALLGFITEKIKFKEIINEWTLGYKFLILLTGISWSLMMITKLRAYQLGEVTKIAPLCSLTVILNIIFAFIFLKERKNIKRKLIASILVTIGVILIK